MTRHDVLRPVHLRPAWRGLTCGILLLLTSACGGGGGGPGASTAGGGTGTVPLALVDVSGTVRGPRDPAGLQVTGAFGSSTVSQSGSYAIQILDGGRHVAVVVDAEERPVYVGWLSPERTTIDARTTAEVLTYFAVGGPFFLDAFRRSLLSDEAQPEEIDFLTQVIEDAYTAGGRDLLDVAPEIKSALHTLLTAVRSRGALVNPPHGRSGIDLDTTVENQLTIRNNYRRRALAWVDRIEGVDSAGGLVRFDEQVQELDVSPTTAYTSVIGTLIDAINGNYMWAPVASAPVPLELLPANGRETTYRVTVLGLGSSWGDYANLSPERQDRFTGLALRTIFADFVTPIIVNLVIPAKSDQIDAFLEWFGGSDVLQDFVTTFAQTMPGLVEKVLAGDLEGAVWDAINAIFSSGTMRDYAMQGWAEAILAFYDLPTAAEFTTACKAFMKALTAVDAIGTALDSAKQIRDVASSRVADQWDVTVTKAKITLSPDDIVIRPGASERFEVVVQDGADRAFAYVWSCGKGTLDDGVHEGTEFESSASAVTYRAIDEGEESIFVDVFEMIGSKRERLGSAAAGVLVKDAEPTVTPERVALKPGDRQVFRAKMQAGTTGSERLFYHWTGGDRFGNHDGAGFIGTRNAVTYVAAYDGVDYLQCEVFVDVNGRMESLGTAEAEIRVEEEPSIIFGQYRAQVWPSGTEANPRVGVYADVIFEAVPGATRYVLRGYGGDDPYHYHQRDIVKTIRAGHVIHDHVQDMPAGEVWVSLSALWGGAAGEAEYVAYMDGRFATGWTWEVEVIK